MSWRLRRYLSLPSTSDLCTDLARAGEPEGLAVLAERQTAGRGSRGRTWESPSGALALSVLLRPREPATSTGHWALLSALALHEALAEHAPMGALSLKWPNDVLIDQPPGTKGKIGGILLDAAFGPEGLDWLVIGFGANLVDALEGAGALADAPDPVRVANAVLSQVDRWRRVRLLEGWGAIRAAWLSRAHPVGTPLRVRTASLDTAGAFDGLASDGALLLRTGGRVVAFATGDVLLNQGA